MKHSSLTLMLIALLVPSAFADDGQQGGQNPARSEATTTGKLSGRFVYEGDPPVRGPLRVPTVRRTLTGEEFRDTDSTRFSQLKLVDETLIVGPDRGIQNILIWIADKSVPVPTIPPVRRLPEPATLTFKDGHLQPHVLAWWAADRALQLKNDDRSPLNLHWQTSGNNNINQLVTAGQAVTFQTQAERIPSKVKSDIYPWMQAAIVFPCAHPYFAVTDVEGYFTINDLPPGEWEFRAWHERCGWVKPASWPKGTFKLKIESSKLHDLGAITVTPGLFESKLQTSRTATPRPVESAKEHPNWRNAGESRRAANEKDEARKWIGNWRLRLPAGFQYPVRLVETDDGLLDLECGTNLTLLGTFAFTKNQLQLVKSKDDGIDDFIWQLNDEGNFVLITDRTRVGGRYIGAVLERTGGE